MAKWMMAAKKADFDGIAQKYGITPVLARIMRNRDMIEEKEIEKFLHGDVEDLYDPCLMKGMQEAAELIAEKIRQGAFLRVIGDYDVDGICAAYLLTSGIRALGGRVDRVIPHRIKDGYGLNDRLIEEAAQDGVDTMITCDNGIAAAEQISLARKMGLTVIVTDHHEVPFEEQEGEKHYMLPPANVVVDPKQPGCGYPFKQICGAVVAGKLLQVLYEQRKEAMPEDGGERKRHLLEEFLVFGALATVCDVMELRDENRILVKKGLELMQHTQNQGLKALLFVNNIGAKPLTPYHAGFIIGPCMNAGGRLDTAERVLSLLETEQWKDAVTAAGELKSLNDSRKQLTEESVAEAVRIIEGEAGAGSMKRDKVLVVYLPDCHESLAGIVAGRLRERYGKPVFVLTKGQDGIKGSGRSIDSYHMYEEMTACKELFTRYGGHKLAAGLSLRDEKQINEFRRRLNENCKLTDKDFEEIIHIDVPLPLEYADRNFIRELSLLEPFGVGNPKPLFARKNISLLSGRKLGKNQRVGKYKIADEKGRCYEMIYFGDGDTFDGFLRDRFGEQTVKGLYSSGIMAGEAAISIAYYPEMNSYGGRESLQFVMQHYC